MLIAAHNNVIRCLCKHIDRLPSDNLRSLEIPTGDPIVYTLNKETLEPIGESDELGFRGKFLDPTDLVDEVNPMTDLIHVNEVVTLEMLQREARRLGLDLATIKCISEITGQMHIPVTSSTAEASSLPSPPVSGDEPSAECGADRGAPQGDHGQPMKMETPAFETNEEEARAENFGGPLEALKEAPVASATIGNEGSLTPPSSSSSSSSTAPPPTVATTPLPDSHASKSRSMGGSSSMADPMDDWVRNDPIAEKDWWRTTGF